MPRTPRELPHAHLSQNQAEGFYRASELLKERVHAKFVLPPEVPIGPGPRVLTIENSDAMLVAVGELIAPVITCLAFACELMLKAHLARHVTETRAGHDLRLLFEDLPVAQRELVKHEMPPAWAARFDEQILACANAFEDWRYSHEADSLTVEEEFLDALYHAVRRVLTTGPGDAAAVTAARY